MNKFLKLAYDYGCKQAALDYADLLPLIGAAAGGYAGSQSEDYSTAGGLLGALAGGAAGYGARGLGRQFVANEATHAAQVARDVFESKLRGEAPKGLFDKLQREHKLDADRLTAHALEMDPVDTAIAARLRASAAKHGPGTPQFINDYAKRLQSAYEDAAPRIRALDKEIEDAPELAEKYRVGALGAGLLGAGGLTGYGLEE